MNENLAFKVHDLKYLKKLRINNSENFHFILNEFQKYLFGLIQ